MSVPDGAAARDTPAFLIGSGALGDLIARFDWAATPIGPMSGWSPAMKTTLAFVLRSPLPIVTLWGDSGVMIYNDAYRDFAGARHPALLGTNVLEGWHEVADFNANVMQKVYREGGTLSYKDQELTLVRDGTPRVLWTDLEYCPAFGDNGTPIGVIAIVIETTDTVVTGQARRDERRRLLQMAEHSPSFMALLEGPDHRFAMTNPAYQQLIGDRQLIGRPLAEALPDAAAQGFVGLLDDVFRTRQPYHANAAGYLVQPDPGGPASERFLDYVFQPLIDDAGAVSGIFISGVDVTPRIVAQTAILASEAQFRTLAQSLPGHIWTSAPDGLLDWINDRGLAYVGRPFEKLVGNRWISIIHPDDINLAAERWAVALASSETFETEFRLRAGDGSYRWHLGRAMPVRDASGQVTRWVGINTDIHEQKLSHAESAADRDRLWAISQDLMMVCTFDGIITAVNPSVTRLLGWSDDAVVGHRLDEFIHPDDLTATAREMKALTQGITTLAFENRYRTIEGDYRVLAWTAVPDRERIHAVGRDITDERRLARDRDRIWSLSPVLKVVTDGSGVVTDVNPTWTKVLGWTRDDTLGRRTTDFMVDDEAFWRERVATLSAGTPMFEYETTLRTKAGEQRLIRWSTVPEEGTFYGFGRDITVEREAAETLAETEAALRQAHKMEAVGQLTGGIAHDFNNLLQGITGSLEIIQRRIEQGRIDDLERFITGATTAASRAAALTHRLLAFSRRQPLDPKPVRANALTLSMEDLLHRTLGERITLELALDPDLWVTKCDPNQLESAVLNLVINARDAMPDGGTLSIETKNRSVDLIDAGRNRGMKPGEYICICVADTGTGMDADTIAKAFEPFFTTKPIGQGTGLGLSMIYGFAQQSDGYARIDSKPGLGTKFELFLPRFHGVADEEVAARQLGERHLADAGEVVLVVEDEPVVRGLILEELAELGYRTIDADDGPSGLEILCSDQRIDLLVTDIGLPGLNGRQVADAARELRPELKVLFMTGYAESAALASGFLEPGMAMITKPFAMEALAARIRTMIEAN